MEKNEDQNIPMRAEAVQHLHDGCHIAEKTLVDITGLGQHIQIVPGEFDCATAAVIVIMAQAFSTAVVLDDRVALAKCLSEYMNTNSERLEKLADEIEKEDAEAEKNSWPDTIDHSEDKVH